METESRIPGRWAELAHSRWLAELCWWYLVCVLATSAAKLAVLSSVYRHSDGPVLDELGAGTGRGLLLVLVLARDVLQCALISGAVFLACAASPARARAYLQRSASALLVLAILVNHVAFMQLGTFASRELLTTAWGWVRLHPGSLAAYATPGAAAVCILSAFGVVLPGVLSRGSGKTRLRRGLPMLALTVVLVGLVAAPIASARFGARAFPVHGYWTQVAAAAWAGGAATPLSLQPPSQRELLAGYARMAFHPVSRAVATKPLHPEIEARRAPRHLIMIGLETAARAFYPLTTSPDLPTFARMTRRALVNEHHYTTSPYTRIANFSMLSGLYAPASGLPVRFGAIATDGFASVLRTQGYETTYVDSWVLDWLPGTGERAQARMLGFDTILDSSIRRDDGVYEVLLAAEEVAFDRAFARVVHAQDNGHKACVFVGTMLGHGPWVAAPGREHLSGAERLHEIALVFDRLLARLLQRLDARGLGEEVIIVVAGDHGLRYAEEFESLGRAYSHSDLSFNVPFMLYAPGLIDETIRLPYATSHIDISPTLLHLVGLPSEGLLYDGAYMLDPRLESRILWLSSSRLGPLDGLRYENFHITYHALSGLAALGDGRDAERMVRLTELVASTLPLPLREPATLIDAFDQHANLVAGRLLQRGSVR